MSRELIFYPACKDNKTGKYKPLLFDVNGEPASIFWRSQSFIDLEFFTEELPMLGKDEFDESCKKYFVSEDEDSFFGDMTYVFKLSMGTMAKESNHGLVSGYVPIEDAKGYYESDERQEYLTWEMYKPIPAELYADLPASEREKYVKFTAIDEYSKGYVCSTLLDVLNDIWIPYDMDVERCVLVKYSF